jgi:signal transduction histidine kinase/CheY-like chemotaxis protein
VEGLPEESVPKERVLIADDMTDILDLCKRILTREGYEVEGVGNGFEAIELAKKAHFDLFLTDIMMPGLKGLETAQAIREILPECVIVVMTGFGTMDTAIQALRLGFSEFVVKPFRPQDLQSAINRALEKERLRRENERLNALVPLFELSKAMMATVEQDELAAQVLQTACSELDADVGVLMLLDQDPGRLRIRATSCENGKDILEDCVDGVLSASERLLEEREQVLVQAREDVPPTMSELMECLGAGSLLFNPLLAMDTSVGALVLTKAATSPRFAPGDSELLSVLCGQAAVALQNASLFEEIQRAYRELQKLDHMKSEFINIAAHELRTPLAILMGHADLLENDITDPTTKVRLQIILRNALRLRGLIDALLDLRHLQTGQARVRITHFDIGDLIDEVLSDFRPTSEGKEIQVSVNVQPGLPSVQSDREKLQYALTNLVDNAIRFTPSGGTVGVTVGEHEDELHVAVWDTGVGIAKEEYERIFRPFYQVEDSLTREHEGMGVGLSIAKELIELCGGRIWVESVPAQGSRFTFTIPR